MDTTSVLLSVLGLGVGIMIRLLWKITSQLTVLNVTVGVLTANHGHLEKRMDEQKTEIKELKTKLKIA